MTEGTTAGTTTEGTGGDADGQGQDADGTRAGPPYAELHAASAFSLLRAGSPVEALVARAAALGLPALALADHMTLGGVVRFQAACARRGIKGIVGAELAVADPVFGDAAAPATLVALAEDATGYARLCRLLTDANLAAPDAPVVPFAALAAEPTGLIVLTGGRDGALARLLTAGRRQAAEAVARRYRDAFGPAGVFVEVRHHRLPDSVSLADHLAGVADEAGLRLVATNGVRHATREEYRVYDLLTCVRLGTTVDTPHRERPRNDEGHLKAAAEMATLFAPFPWGRDELIRHVERTYTHEHAAMVANVVRHRPRLALRDAAKALGYPPDVVNRLTKVLPHHCGPEELPGYAEELGRTLRAALPAPADAATLARCLARLPTLLALVPRLCGLPRHLSLHNGGLVLTREPLPDLLPVRVSTNGVRALEVDKDDVEALGLIKFDLLGLRTLGAVEEALALIAETTGRRPDVDRLPTAPPDAATMRLIRAGQTLAVFQIESPGQWHLLAQTQPETFDDLVIQTALFRPGPIQANMVHPYLERRRQKQQAGSQEGQRAAVQTPWRDGQGPPPGDLWTAHPILGPILADSEGILLFQEQILQIAHAYAGLSYGEADRFRRAMGGARTRAELAVLRERFVAGATARGEAPEDAGRVFDALAAYAGYGFCRSHAAEFARTIYQTAWLKCHYPAHYLAAFLSAQPAGFFPPHVVLHEARLLGIPVLPPDVNRSASKFGVERVGVGATPRRPEGRWAIRIGLRQVAHVGDELADAILWERRARPFALLADLCRRLRPAGLTREAAEALVLSGACDGLPPRMERRRRLWHLHELWPLVGTTPRPRTAGTRGRRRAAGREPEAEQLAIDWTMDDGATASGEDLPPLPSLTGAERDALDYGLLGLSARPHPMRLLRRGGVRAIAELADVPAGRVVRVAGWAVSAQRPPTAQGMAFVVLEDEGGRLPVAVPPRLADDLYRRLRDARAVVVAGRLERVHWYRALLAHDLQRVA